jgi:PAS domain S-box-containing protein
MTVKSNGLQYPDPHNLGRAIDFLVDARIFGFAWLDDDLVTRWRLGGLTSWLPLEKNICAATPLFFGLEKDLLDLQDEHGSRLSLPRVGFRGVRDEEADAKLAVDVFWDDHIESYLMVMTRLSAESDIEFELVKQIRARRLAEDNYNKARAQIVEKQSLLDTISEYAPVPVAIFDAKLNYIFATRRWMEEFNLQLQPLVGQSHRIALASLSPEEAARRETCLSGRSAASDVERLDLEGGGRHWLRWAHQPWRRPDGSVGGIVTFAQILTDIMERQRLIEEKNNQLAVMNRDLEAFASILAHDLSAPVRAICGHARRAVEGARAGGTTDPPVLSNLIGELEAIGSQASRAGAMIAGLLEYAKAGMKSDLLRGVDVLDLVRQIIAATPGAETFEFRFENEQPEQIVAAVAPLELTLRNLIGNAVKHHDRATGVITVSAFDEGDCWLFVIADDGPGIAPEFHEVVFEPFRTLNDGARGRRTPEEGAGSVGGVGLALVKRTIANHGGVIEIDSDPKLARGSRFKVWWPKNGKK